MNLHNRACKALTVQHEKLCYWCWLTNDYIAYLSMNFWSWGERMLYSCCFYCDDVRNHVWISCCHGDDHGHCDVSVFVWRWLLIAYGVDYPQVLLKKNNPWLCLTMPCKRVSVRQCLTKSFFVTIFRKNNGKMLYKNTMNVQSSTKP